LKGISVLFALVPILLIGGKELKIAILDEEGKLYKNISLNFIMRGAIAIFLAFSMFVSIGGVRNFQVGVMTVRYSGNPGFSDASAPIKDFSSEITVIKDEYKKYSNIPFADYLTKEYRIITVNLKNTSSNTWFQKAKNDGSCAVFASYHWFKKDDLSTVVLDGVRNRLPADVLPGEECTFDMYVKYPERPGDYILRLTMIQEGVAWFYHVGGAYIDMPVTIK
jgi:hypothetical protein